VNEVTASHDTVIIDGLAARYGGTAQAAVEVAQRLAGRGSVSEVIVVTRRGSLIAEELAPQPGLRLVTLPPQARFELLHRLAWQAHGLPLLVSRCRARGVLTWSGMLPWGVGAPVISLLSNAAMFEERGTGNRIRRWATRRTSRQAARVLVPSLAMAGLVEREIGRPVGVVPHGVNHQLFGPSKKLGNEILYVADFYPHKRHLLLVAAWESLDLPRPTLHLIGDSRVDPVHHRRVVAAAESLRRLGEVKIQERLPQADLVAAYHCARVFAVPSTLESFCMPLLEAQACGVPCLANDLPVLRETGGEGATYLQSASPRQWAAVLAGLIQDDARLAAAREAGLENARRFSWNRTVAAIESCLAQGA